MIILAKLIALAITILGLAVFTSPQFSQKLFNFFKEGRNLYIAGVVRVLIGLLLLVIASQSVVPVAAVALGVLFLVSGIVVFAADIEKMRTFITAYSEMPSLVIRLLGLVAATFGILIFSIF
ncbi:MAG: DUF2065 family protein [Candidatus Omnitrophica bacterium]|nr:DUF2065 family protein [Candidatus Omnitrophota bacterium]